MDRTTKEIGDKHGLPTYDPRAWHYIEAAMLEYAAQEAKSYASWLSNQVYAGRTSEKLWADYKAEVLDQQPSRYFTPKPPAVHTRNTVGSRVRIGDESSVSLANAPKTPGTIVDRAFSGLYDYIVGVLWDGQKEVGWIHESHLEVAK
jgi:hypothetical protein